MPAVMQVTFYKDDIANKIGDELVPRLAMVATEYADEVKLRMRNGPATGKIYGLRRTRRGKRVLGPGFAAGRRVHRASAPGEPPAPDTGRLIQSVQWRVRKVGDLLMAEVGSDVRYALYLEYGAARGVKNRSGKITKVQWILFPRPVWGPALIALRPRIAKILSTPVGSSGRKPALGSGGN
jgi:hypothetical protein